MPFLRILPRAAVLFAGLALGFASHLASGDATSDAALNAVLKHIPPTEPAESLKTFRVEKGFAVEIAAAEPNVTDPVDMAWDEEGRLYVCELWNYPGEPGPNEPLGRIRRLESTHGDGIYDKSTIFADGVKWPGGIAVWDGGVFVASSPDIWYFKDTTGSGVADVRTKVFTGFRGRTYEVANSLRWDLDQHIYVCGSYAGGEMAKVGDEAGKEHARDFRFDPRTLKAEAVTGGGEFGQTFDDWGNLFTCDATHLVWHPVLPHDELARNPFLAVSNTQQACIPEWTQLFPISAPEPWKAARQQFWTRWVNTNSDMHASRFPDKELAPQGFATSASGITVYRGSQYGPEYDGDAFVGEPANNVVIRLKLRPDGAGFKAERPERDTREKREFLASTDNWFRPVNFANGPDGCLYVAAMYREIIEDETAIPGDILKHYDLHTGRDRGRILRIVPEKFTRPAAPHWGASSTTDLVAALDNPDSWTRETAQRLIYQRQDRTAVDPLKVLVASAKLPQGRILALWTLSGLDALDAGTAAAALADTDPRVREQAVEVSEDLLDRSDPLRAKLAGLSSDSDFRVRFRTAMALGHSKDESTIDRLAVIARQNAGDRWMRSAILCSTSQRSGALLALLARDSEFQKKPGGKEMLGELASVAGARNDSSEIAQVLALLQAPELSSQKSIAEAILRNLASGLSRAGSSLGKHLGSNPQSGAAKFFDEARATAADATQPEGSRADAIQLLSYLPSPETGRFLAELLAPAQPLAVQLAAVRALSLQQGPEAAAAIVSRWPSIGPAVRPDALDALFRRPEHLAALVDGLESGQIKPIDLDPRRRDALLKSLVGERAGKFLKGPQSATKDELVARYGKEVLPLKGDSAQGQIVFRNTCAICHKPETGVAPGPNLATLEDRSPGTLITAILDPNREVKPNYISYELITNDGQDLSGVIANETANSVTIRRPGGGEETLLRTNLKSIQSTGLSLMPDGLEAALTYQQMADLLSYLKTMR